ncbi:MAG: SIMPL domain-containing protein [Gammaproteobacteria bacterium]|nr:SIMPL domain-containing protein [Gammaproteobacteria bacterium]
MSARILAIVLLGLLPGCSVADPATPVGGRIVVTGNAEVRTLPDRARFTVGVTTEARDADAALAENARRTQRLLAALRDSGIPTETLRTLGVTLQPRWSGRPRDADEDWTPKVTGYHAGNRLEVETGALDRVGELLAIAAEAGANEIHGVQFSLEDDAEARRHAIERATRRAREEAGILAEAAGVRTGAVLELRLDHARTDLPAPNPRMEMALMSADRRGGNVPVEPGEVTIRASVTLTLAVSQP